MMFTNILATIIIAITTNTFAPKQYWHESNIVYCDANYGGSYSPQGSWQDSPPTTWGGLSWPIKVTERDNPDVRITEVREIKTLSFEFEVNTWSAEVSNVVLSEVRSRRVVKTDETWEVETALTNAASVGEKQ